MIGTALVALTLATPIGMLLACFSPHWRARMLGLLGWAAVPGLVAALFAEGSRLVVTTPLAFAFAMDRPAAILVLSASILWTAGGFYAGAWFRDVADKGRFAEWWLLTLAGSLGVFLASDLVGFYLTFSVVSLAAWGLVAHDRTTDAVRAARIYVGVALLGEAFLLMAFVLLAQSLPAGELSIAAAVVALPGSPVAGAALALLILGFGAKIGMVPLHFWMPPTYRAAPIPAAAVLSGAAVKAGIVGFVDFLPLQAAFPTWGAVLATAGFVSAFFGVVAGMLRTDPRVVLAYSSISQMGLLAAALGTALAAGGPASVPVAWYAAMHILVKGGLFLGLGVLAAAAGGQRRLILGCLAVLALSLAGLPLTGGYLAKLAVKPVLGDGLSGWLGILSAIGSAMLMTHFLMLCGRQIEPVQSARITGLGPPWIAVVAASILVPWTTSGWLDAGTLGGLGLGNIVKALGPVLLGIGLAAFFRIRIPPRLTRLMWPPADTDIAGESPRLSAAWIRAWATADAVLRRWQVASTLLLVIAIVLGATMLRSAPAPDPTPRSASSTSP